MYLVLVRQKIDASTVVTYLTMEPFEDAQPSHPHSHSCRRNHHRSFPVVILLTHQARDALLAPRLAKAFGVNGKPLTQSSTQR